MSGINKVIILGNVGADPEARTTPSGLQLARFSVATSIKWTDKASGEKREKTEWHRVVVFGRLAELVTEYVAKGDKIYVEGELSTRKWQDDSGNDRYMTEIIAQNVQFLGAHRGDAAPRQESGGMSRAAREADESGEWGHDDIPF